MLSDYETWVRQAVEHMEAMRKHDILAICYQKEHNWDMACEHSQMVGFHRQGYKLSIQRAERAL